jgi:SMC interacting uncharacterized protein involved in chromosome segregation
VALSDFIDFTRLFQLIRGFLGPFGKLFDSLKKSFDHVINVMAAADKLAASIREEIDGWKNFKQDIRLKQRVIQLESAIQKTRDLIEGIPESWHKILDLIKQIKGQVGGAESPVEDAEAIAEDLESGGVKKLLQTFPKLARALEKILGVLAIVIQALEAITEAIDDVQTIVDELKRIRLEIEKLDTIFLSQSNPRKTVRLADGSTMKIRLGNLH